MINIFKGNKKIGLIVNSYLIFIFLLISLIILTIFTMDDLFYLFVQEIYTYIHLLL